MKRLKIVNKIFLALFFIGLIIVIASQWMATRTMLYVGLGVCLLGLVVYAIFYRCPYCGHFLGRNEGEFCAKCGKRISDGK